MKVKVAPSCPTLCNPMDYTVHGILKTRKPRDQTQVSHIAGRYSLPSEPQGKSWCWERLKAGGEGDDRRWDGWMASPTRWTWVWVDSGSWWWTERPGLLQSVESQGVGHDWVTELNYYYKTYIGFTLCAHLLLRK